MHVRRNEKADHLLEKPLASDPSFHAPETIRIRSDQQNRLVNSELGFLLGWNDVFNRYRRSNLGAFWLTLSMGILIATLGIIFAALFSIPLNEFLPHVCLGLIFWTYISTQMNEGCLSFIQADSIILQIKLPLMTHILRVWWRNTIILAHNITIYPFVLLLFLIPLKWEMLLVIPGFVILSANVFWLAFVLGLLCTRFRDITLIVQNFLQVLFYATPIMWLPEILEGKTIAVIVNYNPAFHLIEIVRAPLMGFVPAWQSYATCIAMAVIGWIIAFWALSRFERKLPYWL